MSKYLERHARLGQYLKDVVFAANDGIVTTFAVIAGTVGADLSVTIILIIGIASLIADGFSMATGNYLGTKSEQELYYLEESREKTEVRTMREEELLEIRKILSEKGFTGDKLEQMIDLISSNEKYWVDFMMHEELSLYLPSSKNPLLHAVATFCAFILAGILPLLPYLFIQNSNNFLIAGIFAGLTLFTVGALRKFFSARSWLMSGLEMLLVGGSAALIAFLIGFVLKSLLH